MQLRGAGVDGFNAYSARREPASHRYGHSPACIGSLERNWGCDAFCWRGFNHGHACELFGSERGISFSADFERGGCCRYDLRSIWKRRQWRLYDYARKRRIN
jgi:hypothetical protein